MEKPAQINQNLANLNPFKDHATPVKGWGERLWAAASYIYFFSTVALLLRKDNSDFVTFHAKHAIVFLILTFTFLLIPGWFKVVASLLLLASELLAVYLALIGKRYYIPYLTNLVRNFEI